MAFYDSDSSLDLRQNSDQFLCTSTPPTRPSTFQRLKLRSPHPRRRCWPTQRRCCITLIALGIIATCLYLTWLSLVAALLTRFAPPNPPPAGVRTLLSTWHGPADSAPSPAWLARFSAGVAPVRCHSHNDYWRPVPLFAALAAGCTGVEADIWLSSSSVNPLVGHTRRSLDATWTLSALYVEPLVAILGAANVANETTAALATGVFETSPETTLVLLLDFKEWEGALWEAVQRELNPLREKGWLTYWSQEEMTRVVRPVTVVVTGEAPFEAIEKLEVKDIFYDAPLDQLEGSGNYSAENSYYASVKLRKVVGRVGWHGLSKRQADRVRKQAEVAAERGLVSRYWETPSWPVALRNRVWDMLVENGVGVLNVDELTTATRWDWRFCTVLGLTICK